MDEPSTPPLLLWLAYAIIVAGILWWFVRAARKGKERDRIAQAGENARHQRERDDIAEAVGIAERQRAEDNRQRDFEAEQSRTAKAIPAPPAVVGLLKADQRKRGKKK